MSMKHTCSSLWQIQEGHPKLIGYGKSYSVTELEMTALLVNIALWKAYLQQCEFDACVYHAAVLQILKAKKEPTTNHMMRLLDRICPCSFNLYYVKRKNMILAD